MSDAFTAVAILGVYLPALWFWSEAAAVRRDVVGLYRWRQAGRRW